MDSLASCVCNIKPKYRCAYTSVLVTMNRDVSRPFTQITGPKGIWSLVYKLATTERLRLESSLFCDKGRVFTAAAMVYRLM